MHSLLKLGQGHGILFPENPWADKVYTFNALSVDLDEHMPSS